MWFRSSGFTQVEPKHSPKLQVTLREQGLLVKKTTDNLEAYDAFLRGQESLFRAGTEAKKEANEQARQMYERAIELDPRYAGAYVGLGLTYFHDWFYRWNSTPQILARAGELAQQAVTLDESLPGPHAILGLMYVWQKQHNLAIKEAERAIALDPNLDVGYAWLGGILGFAGRPEEGIPMVERAMRLNPRYPVWYLLHLGLPIASPDGVKRRL
jgi:adenylate cyclase